MQKLLLKQEVAEKFHEAASDLMCRIIAQNIDAPKELIVQGLEDVFDECKKIISPVYDELVSNPDFMVLARTVTDETKKSKEKMDEKSDE